MFGHLKAAQFMNVLEGATLPDKHRMHLESCRRCADTLASVRGVQTKVMEMGMAIDEHIPEPDWSDFRADVRTKLLSRSVKRETTAQRWMGWTWKPAMVWSMSVMFVLGLTAGMVVWNRPAADIAQQEIPAMVSFDSLIEPAAIAEMSDWTETDLFEEVVRLDDNEAEILGNILQGMTREIR